MEEDQKERINQQLEQLIDQTNCNALFLAKFQKNNILSRSDIEILNAEESNKGRLQQSSRFYEIIQTRRGAYDVLLEALSKTCQNGALALLENDETEPSKKLRKTIGHIKPPKYLQVFLNGVNDTLVIHTPDCEITRGRIIENVEHVTEYTPKSFVDSIPVTSSKPSSSKPQEFPLINCQHGINHLKYSLKDTKKKIILLPEKFSDEIHELQVKLQCKKVQHENDDLEWDDLHPSMQISVEENLKSFQLPVDCDAVSKLKGKVLFELIKGNQPTLFKNTVPPKINYYISRRLITRNIISKEVFQSGGRDLFLLKGIKRHELTEIANGQETDTSSNLIEKNALASIKFALLDCDSDYDIIVERVGGQIPVHVFQYHEDKLIWVKSSGGIYTVQGAVDSSQNTLTEDEFLENIVNSQTNKNDPVCISDSPGMGKTVLLASMGHKLQKTSKKFWNIGFIVISELVEKTKQFANKPELKERVTSYLASVFCENELGVAYFQGHTNELTNLLLDGLDELQAENVMFGYDLLTILREMLPNTKIWVTTRPHMFANLEQTLNVLGYNILEFEENDQVNFLKLYWSRESAQNTTEPQNFTTFAQSCLSTIKAQINSDREQDIAGIPLQCLLIGEVFEDDALRFGTTTEATIPSLRIKSVTDLYEQLVTKKFNKFYERYDKDNCGYVDLTKEHIFYSLWLLFPTFRDKFGKEYRSNPLSIQAVFNVGILESKSLFPSPRFIHRTFAEYFVAKFVVDALSSPLTLNLFNLLYKNILKTKRVAQQKFGKAKLSSRQFVHNVVCYFIDSLIGKTGGVNCKDELSTKCSNFKLEQWKQLCEGCAYGSFEHIFHRLVFDLPSFAQFKKDIFTDEFVVLCTMFSDASMATKVYEIFKDSDKDLSKVKWQGYSLVQFAVIRGNYKLFERNAAMTQQDSFQVGEFCWSLVCDCVSESKSNSCHIIKEKFEILNYLLGIIDNSQFSLKFQKYDQFLSSTTNIDLAIKLVECTEVTEEGTRQFVHKATRWYNCTDYQRLLKSLAAKSTIGLRHVMYEKKFKLLIMKNMDLNPEFLQFMKEYGVNLNVLDMLDDKDFFRKDTRISDLIKLLDCESTQVDENGNTKLHKMCTSTKNIAERLELIQHLIDKGADLNAKNNNSETPFDILSKQNFTKDGLQMMNLMESSRKNIKENFFLKINWIFKGSEEMKLTDYADICSKVTATQPIMDKNGNTLLHLVTKLNDYLAIEHLLSLGVDVNAQNKRKETPLHVAIQNIQISFQSWKTLVDNGADPCLVDIDGKTPIYKLYWSDKKFELIEYSMKHALRVHSPMLEQIFLLALSCCYFEDIKKLCVWFTENVSASLSSIQGNFKGRRATVLDAALHNTVSGNVLEYIVETQKCQTALLPYGYVWFYKSLTKWHMHNETKFLEVVSKLFPDLINTPDENGLHPLSAKGIYLGAAHTLIKLGANVNVVDKFGNTPLHWALKHNDSGYLVDALVKGGADVNAATHNGETPLLLSLKTNYGYGYMTADCFIQIIEHDADLRSHFSFDNTILHQVVKNVWAMSLPDVMEVLLKKGYQDLLQRTDMNNQTPFQIAQQRYEQGNYGDNRLIKVFRKYGIQI